MKPLVSVIIPTYNRNDRLCRSVLSVLEQTYDPIEIIIVDDHSDRPATDVIGDIIAENKILQTIRHESNQGANAARNTGIQAASGDYIAFLDDDDEWHPEKIDRQISVINSESNKVSIVYSGIRINRDERTSYKSATAEGDLTKQLLKKNVVGTFSTILIRSKIVDQAGNLDERFPSWQDKEWYVRLSQHGEFKPINEPLVTRHMEGSDHLSDDLEQLSKKTQPLFVEKYESLARSFGWRYYRQWRSMCAQNVAGYALRLGHEPVARRYLIESIKWHPLRYRPYCLLGKSIIGKTRQES
ncbi:glycosyltransferase family 2 protein [Haloplanus halophilus]|uniref:glycosyltransferase family 2 protein n=1 Tax=Haloplanus halophilus TaxID=2949993 RepID=UPI002112744C|nr:glycosyltransferase [Haloplanus sp. GDY1]